MGDSFAPWSVRRKQLAAIALFAVSVVAIAATVAGLTTGPGNDTSADIETALAEPPTPTMAVVVTPSVAFPTTIPGCDKVDPPDEESFGWASFSSSSGYDNPKYPWFSGPKAVAMSNAVRAALPTDVEVEFASPAEELLFGPISDPDVSQIPEDWQATALGWTNATAGLKLGDERGRIWVQVRHGDNPPPPCVAGQLDERRTLPDGTVVDLDESWRETDGHRSTTRTVSAYLPDGSRIHANAGDEIPTETDPAKRYSGTVPLTLDQLVGIVTAPGLRVSTSVPEGTPLPPESCSTPGGDGRKLTRDDVAKINRSLDEFARTFAGITFDRPLGSLQLADYGRTSLCQILFVTTPGRESRISFMVDPGQSRPEQPDVYDPNYDSNTTLNTLPDGAVMETGRHEFEREATTVTVTKPSGTKVRISSTGTGALPIDQLQALATAPGLELPR